MQNRANHPLYETTEANIALANKNQGQRLILRIDTKMTPINYRISTKPVPENRKPRATTHQTQDLASWASEEALRHSEHARLAAIVEMSDDAILSKDTEGIVTSWNAAAQRLFGYRPEEIIGRSITLLLPPERQEEEASIMSRLNAGEQVDHFETVRLAKDGRRLTVSVTISPLKKADGQVIGASKIIRDITQQRRLEEQLRQAQKMEAVGQLASGVAHDFNNILVATLMHLGLLQSNPHLSPETKETLMQLEKEALRAANLTRQLLLFSRQQAARIGPLEINAVINNMVKMLQRLLGENVEIVNHLSSETNWANADEGMMEQVVMNLCINARDAMPKGGQLRLAATTIEIPAQSAKLHADARPGRFVCLSVVDTGCGMDKAVLEKIFEPFFTTKEVGKGTGLGLATVYGIVKQHHGWVEVESRVGHGSAFRVYIPGTKPLVTRAFPSDAGNFKGGSETILLVEDESYMRLTIALCLRKLGYAVLEAGSGAEALKVWEEHHEKIALLFTDTLMPGRMNGLELAGRLKKKKGSLRIINSSGYHPDSARAPVTMGEEIAFLPKPYKAADLAKVVRECLDKR